MTNSIEFKEVITSTHMCSRRKENLNKVAESSDSLPKGTRSQGKVRQTLSSRWFELISPFQASIPLMFGFVSRFVGGVCRCINQCQSGPWCVAT